MTDLAGKLGGELAQTLASAYSQAAIDGVEAVKDWAGMARKTGVTNVSLDDLVTVLGRIQDLFRKEVATL